jgi:hypothetical protein
MFHNKFSFLLCLICKIANVHVATIHRNVRLALQFSYQFAIFISVCNSHVLVYSSYVDVCNFHMSLQFSYEFAIFISVCNSHITTPALTYYPSHGGVWTCAQRTFFYFCSSSLERVSRGRSVVPYRACVGESRFHTIPYFLAEKKVVWKAIFWNRGINTKMDSTVIQYDQQHKVGVRTKKKCWAGEDSHTWARGIIRGFAWILCHYDLEVINSMSATVLCAWTTKIN